MYDSKGTLNKVFLIGRLGQNPELKSTPSGKNVISLSLATNSKGKNEDMTEWHKLVAWDKTADIIAKYATKGTRLYIDGRLQTRSWTDKDGNKRYTTEVVVDRIQFMDGKTNQQENVDSSNYQEPDNHPGYDENGDELPF